jgi:hypothetical protein
VIDDDRKGGEGRGRDVLLFGDAAVPDGHGAGSWKSEFPDLDAELGREGAE